MMVTSQLYNTTELTEVIGSGDIDNILKDLYIDKSQLEYQRKRYINALNRFTQLYGEGDVLVFSAPGRSEIGGNHTDHQNGKVLAASINLDIIAVVRPVNSKESVSEEGSLSGHSGVNAGIIRIVSDDYPMIQVSLSDTDINKEEYSTTKALVKGVIAGFKKKGFKTGAFDAFITSDVPMGAGLSSSAAFETLIGTIQSHIYNAGKVSAEDIAVIGQMAENEYFGKPCGLMDQMACSVGNMVYIDFNNKENPVVNKLAVDIKKFGYSLCITDTKGSHKDLTDDYADIRCEMNAVASYFGQEVLRGITLKDILDNFKELQEKFGDRSILRAVERVENEVNALISGNIDEFLRLVSKSGDSSYKYLQNIYSTKDTANQGISLGLMMSEIFLGDNGAYSNSVYSNGSYSDCAYSNGVCRVHGGGFAGTILAIVKDNAVDEYRRNMDKIFGDGASMILQIRHCGGVRII